MAKLTYYEHTNESLAAVCNNALEHVLAAAFNKGVITPEQFTELQEYRVVVSPPTMWGKLYAKVFDKDTQTANFIYVVKHQTIINPSEKEHYA